MRLWSGEEGSSTTRVRADDENYDERPGMFPQLTLLSLAFDNSHLRISLPFSDYPNHRASYVRTFRPILSLSLIRVLSFLSSSDHDNRVAGKCNARSIDSS